MPIQLLCLLLLNNLLAAVLATGHAHTMAKNWLAAIRANDRVGTGKKIMRASSAGAGS